MNSRRAEQLARANPILTVLKGDAGAASQKRLIATLRGMQELETRCAAVRGQQREQVVVIGGRNISFRDDRFDDGDVARKAFKRETDLVLKKLNGQLSRTQQFHRLELIRHDTELVLHAEFHARSGSIRRVEEAIYWLLYRYLPQGEIGRFRNCEECGKWLFAVTEHQKYCSEKCRMRHISHSPQFREKRARYMRERYRPQLEERAKRLDSRKRG